MAFMITAHRLTWTVATLLPAPSMKKRNTTSYEVLISGPVVLCCQGKDYMYMHERPTPAVSLSWFQRNNVQLQSMSWFFRVPDFGLPPTPPPNKRHCNTAQELTLRVLLFSEKPGSTTHRTLHTAVRVLTLNVTGHRCQSPLLPLYPLLQTAQNYACFNSALVFRVTWLSPSPLPSLHTTYHYTCFNASRALVFKVTWLSRRC